jgi:hypothetical protein
MADCAETQFARSPGLWVVAVWIGGSSRRCGSAAAGSRLVPAEQEVRCRS